MKLQDEILLNIESIALSGDGIAREEGVVFFVEGALPGEKVKAQITKVEKNLVRARALDILEASPHRTKPRCPHFGTCGGCVFQHLSYEAQLEVKRRELEQMFAHLGGFDSVSVEPVIPSPKPFHYRNTVALTVRRQSGKCFLGFIGRDNQTFIPIDECPIAEEKLNSLIPRTRQAFDEFVPEQKKHKTSQIVVRVGRRDQFYTSIKKDPQSAAFLTAEVNQKEFWFAGFSFFQTNFSVLEDFVRTVREMLGPGKDKTLLDLYCGVGLFALCFASEYREAIGVEESEDTIRLAGQNAERNGVGNARFMSARTEDWLKDGKLDQRPFHVVLDPPRVGMKKEAVEALLSIDGIERLVYVSCDPATLIRDLRLLAPRFKIERVKPIDMFPQTRHLETVVLLLPKT